MSTALPLVVTPLRGGSTLCTLEQGRLVPITPLPVPPGSRHAISAAGWIVHLNGLGEALGRLHTDAEPHEQRFGPLRLPAGSRPLCLAFHGQSLFVGGATDDYDILLGRFDLDEIDPAWEPIPPPDRITQTGKGIHDLLVDGDRLIAVDNIITPKYLFIGALGGAGPVRMGAARELPSHGTYEVVQRGALGVSWVALLSQTMGQAGAFSHIALLDRASLLERGSLHARIGSTAFALREPVEPRDWNDIAWRGDLLVVAAGDDGVGLLDMTHIPAPTGSGRPAGVDNLLGQASSEEAAFVERCREQLTYFRTGAMAGTEVVGVLTVPGAPQVVLVCRGEDGELDSIVFDPDHIR